ncbi:helix-turn-helix domain-containing protein [Flavobacterium sp. TMP13]|uniref:helix-turn-helix domain-containing protein n=1 Tax=unclassified Flavobacterium TaxID=196869 RepID=UPI00076DDA75|nr:helix-turn-helix domain-containing protein [Flavobacterium sp. TAB 87]KVV15984.1 DNA binding domain, excisionase family [Flavobacterium sp. TAB 87]
MSSNIKITRICQFCNIEFTAKTTKTKYCSLKCGSKNYKIATRKKKINISNEETNKMRYGDVELLKKLEFLSIKDTCELFGISKRTLYRIIERGELDVAKLGSRTIIRRCDMDNFFALPQTSKIINEVTQKFPGIEKCYTITEAQKSFNISPSALYLIIQRQGIMKYNLGKFTYVAKHDLDLIFNSVSNE